MTDQDISGQIRDFITNTFLEGEGDSLDNDSPLLEWGVIDSMNVLELVDFLEDSFDVQVTQEHLNPVNLVHVGAITALVNSIR